VNSPKVKPDAEGGIGPNRLMDLYGQMLLIRHSEERLSKLFADGEVPGFIHLSIGQEAVSVGVMSALTAQDTIASTHRGHGHAIAKGL
jgi:TPP-dependent pyruvate/acetoin dehydrogenase alpha subunit